MKHGYETAGTSLTTATALLAAAIIFSLLLFTLFIPAGSASGTAARAGMVRVTDTLVLSGDITGYADTGGLFGTVRVDNPAPFPDMLGALLVPVRLASFRLSWEQGTGADLGNATVIFSGPSGTETLAGSSGPVLGRSSWAVIRKGSTLPGRGGNRNMLLEPDEVFVLFICPSKPLPPKTPFTVEIRIPGENPFRFSRVVPESIMPVMNLG